MKASFLLSKYFLLTQAPKIFVLFLTYSMVGQADTFGNFTYERINYWQVEITDYLQSDTGHVDIPEEIDNRTVIRIGKSAFRGCQLTSVTIPDSVISIEETAFLDCNRLRSIVIPDGVQSIGDSAFSSCDALTSVSISDSVTSIGIAAFARCKRLTSISVDSGNTHYTSSSGVLFDTLNNRLHTYPAGKYSYY